MNGKNSPRKVHLDLLRIIACYCVIVNHTIRGITLFFQESTSYYIASFLFVVCRLAVPMFFMISGAVLFQKKETYGELVKKRILKYMGAFLLISVFYYIYNVATGGYDEGVSFSVLDFIKRLNTADISNALWFMSAYIAFLIMLPIYRKVSQNMSHFDYAVYFIIWLAVFGVWPVLVNSCGFPPMTDYFILSLSVLTEYTFYAFIGDWIEKMPPKLFSLRNGVISLTIVLMFYVLSAFLYVDGCRKGTPYWVFEGSKTNFVISVPCICLYYSMKCLCLDMKSYAKKAILFVGGGDIWDLFILRLFYKRVVLCI